jgi:hypothetical protein
MSDEATRKTVERTFTTSKAGFVFGHCAGKVVEIAMERDLV